MFEEEGLRFRIREYLKGIAALLLVIWLFRGWIGLEKYNYYMVWGIVILIILVELLGVGRWFGVTLGGIVFSLAKAAFLIAVFLYVGKWLGVPENFPITPKMAFGYFIVLSIAALFVSSFSTPKITKKEDLIPKIERKAYEFHEVSIEDIRLFGEGKAYPLKFGRKKVGWALEGDVNIEVKTPLGRIRRRLFAPVVVWAPIEIKGKKASPNENFILTTESLLMSKSFTKKEEVLDFGIFKLYEGNGISYVKMPFLEVIETPTGEEVKIGPIKIREGSPIKPSKDMITIKELRNGFQLTKVGDNITIITDEYKIDISNDRILYKSGNEKLSLSEDYVSVSSGNISVSVGRGVAKLRIEDAIISARDGIVKIRVGGKTYTISDKEAYKLVIKKAKSIVEEESAEVIEGLGIDRNRIKRRIRELLDELMQYIS
ncbi:hypothetical protein [Pyrococcus sp. ST04]|uniref:hypothetical protein n=1 Tax=Pyrococcus sp. ST04 TaxID=1183377 RepID=UPI0002605EB6|nr:hypothetical protein [Pyrococcus sp. ST04]AFK22610.1 hypothetical protein Py04_1035 [Pyrococcus sp. ST04]